MPTIAEAGPQRCFYHSRGLRLHYLDWGNPGAPVLILIHGGLEHARVWDALAQQLRTDWHVVVPDLRGHGRWINRARGVTPAWPQRYSACENMIRY
ncbi:MAG: alpha/beta fold hydrolase [Thiopseudomonas sp.]